MANKRDRCENERQRQYAMDAVRYAVHAAKFENTPDKDTRPQTKRPCSGCPYRKDRPHVLVEETQLLNVTRIHYGIVQACHAAWAAGKEVRCSGAARCLAGGDDLIVSPNELGTREPATFREAEDRWLRPKQKPKNTTNYDQ